MKYFSPSKIVLLLTCAFSASQVQAASHIFDTDTDLHQNECMVSQFGATADHKALLAKVYETAADELVDAFIACPNEMALVYFEKIVFDGDDALVTAARDSGKMEKFYVALDRLPKPESIQYPLKMDDNRRLLCRHVIFTMSLIHDIPPKFYLDALKGNTFLYVSALLEKATRCRSDDAKSRVTKQLREALSLLDGDAGMLYLSRLVNNSIKLLENQAFDFDSMDQMEKLSLIFAALGFNRYDVARQASLFSEKINLESARSFVTKRNLKTIEQPKEAFAIVGSLLPNDADKEAFNKHVRETFPDMGYL